MHIVLIAKPGHTNTGVGRYVIVMEKILRAQGHEVEVVHPVVPLPTWLILPIKHWLGWDLEAFFNNYAVWTSYPKADIYHITSQNLAILMLLCPPPGKTVITVHDIIPWLLRNNELRTYRHQIDEWFDWLALKSISQCHHIITDSYFTTFSLSESCEVTNNNIQTIYLSIL